MFRWLFISFEMHCKKLISSYTSHLPGVWGLGFRGLGVFSLLPSKDKARIAG